MSPFPKDTSHKKLALIGQAVSDIPKFEVRAIQLFSRSVCIPKHV